MIDILSTNRTESSKVSSNRAARFLVIHSIVSRINSGYRRSQDNRFAPVTRLWKTEGTSIAVGASLTFNFSKTGKCSEAASNSCVPAGQGICCHREFSLEDRRGEFPEAAWWRKLPRDPSTPRRRFLEGARFPWRSGRDDRRTRQRDTL